MATVFTCILTPAGGKRLMARGIARHPAVQAAFEGGTVAVVAGTTNGYVAEELLTRVGREGEFPRARFLRGVTLPPYRATDAAHAPDDSHFPGDVVLRKGEWLRGQTIFDAVDELRAGDVILKGANAVDLARMQAGVLVGHPRGGTIMAALQAVVGRRVRLILPVGLEKRVPGSLHEIAARLLAPGAEGPRLLPVPGEVFTEIEALALLTGAQAELIAAGGVGGAEGAVWLAVRGTPEQEKAARDEVARAGEERPFVL